MADGQLWIPVELYGANNDGAPRRYTIADGTSISKGQTLIMSDPRTVTAATGALAPAAGVASEEHIANQGITSISAWTDGIFEASASDAITVGQPAAFAEANKVVKLITAASGACYAPVYVLETAADEEVINVRLKL